MRLILNDYGTGRIPRTVLFPEAIHPSVQVSSRNRRALSDGDLRVAAFRPRTGSPGNKEFFSLRAAGLQHPVRHGVVDSVRLDGLPLAAPPLTGAGRRLYRTHAAPTASQSHP